jgi:perosamine synthetase
MIHQMEPWIGDEERSAVNDYLTSGGWLTEYKRTAEFARMVGDYVGSRHAFILSNGTVSLYAALKALDIEAGDEVIVPAYTMIASANAVVLTGATPIFVDVDPGHFCLDLDQAESAITARTRALMVVGINGRAPDMDRASRLAQAHGLRLIEDAAQALGARQRGRHLGTFGSIGSFSFSPLKIITTGQGGALVTDDDELAERIGMLRDFGRRQPGVDVHESIGYNFKFTDLQAVVGIEQMKKLEWRIARKKAMYALYQSMLKDVAEVVFPETNLEEIPPWFVDVLVPDPEALKRHLASHQIGSRRFYPVVPDQPAYGQGGDYPHAAYAASHGIWLPSSSLLSDDQITMICDRIREYYAEP